MFEFSQSINEICLSYFFSLSDLNFHGFFLYICEIMISLITSVPNVLVCFFSQQLLTINPIVSQLLIIFLSGFSFSDIAISDHSRGRYITQKMKFSIKDFFSKCDQVRREKTALIQLCSFHLFKNIQKFTCSFASQMHTFQFQLQLM